MQCQKHGLFSMKIQPKILTKLKIIENLYYQGSLNEAIEQTLDKIISQELVIAEQKKAELETDIKQFEQEYQMSSLDFYQRFHRGELSDDVDFVEWNSFYEMCDSLQQRIKILQANENE
jgi:superfamily II helicase